MSRGIHAFQGECHEGASWTCMGCERVICAECEPSPAEFELCAECFDEDGGDAA